MSNLSNTIDRSIVEQIVRRVVQGAAGSNGATHSPSPQPAKTSSDPNLVVSISARHIHLTDAHVEQLFGSGRTLTPGKDLYQDCLLYTSPSPRDRQKSRMPSSA